MRRLLVFGSGAAIIGILLLVIAFFEAYIIVSQLQKALSTTGPDQTIPLLEEATIQAVFLGIMSGVGYALVSKGLDGIRKQEALEMERPILGSVVLAQPARSNNQGLELVSGISPPESSAKSVKPVRKPVPRVRPSTPVTRPIKSETVVRPVSSINGQSVTQVPAVERKQLVEQTTQIVRSEPLAVVVPAQEKPIVEFAPMADIESSLPARDVEQIPPADVLASEAPAMTQLEAQMRAEEMFPREIHVPERRVPEPLETPGQDAEPTLLRIDDDEEEEESIKAGRSRARPRSKKQDP